MVPAVRRSLAAAIAIAAVVTTACASGGGVTRPDPFPSAPAPAARTPPADRPASDASVPPQLDAVIKTALGLRGTRYRLGGESPRTGFDCSGFVRYVFDQHRLEVPRTVAEQFQAGRRIPVDQIRKGDLLFFSTTAKGPTHVGIALGPASLGEFVHAPGSGGAVRVERFDAAYWRGKLIGIRRIR
jgi:cell wall-associated NlpC family hydrolase